MNLGCEGTGKPVSFGVLEDLARRVADGLDDGLDGVFHRTQGIEERVDKLIDNVLVFLFLCRARVNGLVEGGLPGLVAARGGAFAAAAATGGAAFLADFADGAEEGGCGRREDVEEGLQLVERHLQQGDDVLDLRSFDNCLFANFNRSFGERGTERESRQCHAFEGLADDIGDQLAHVVVRFLDELSGFRDRVAH